jgi:hypothetical protein
LIKDNACSGWDVLPLVFYFFVRIRSHQGSTRKSKKGICFLEYGFAWQSLTGLDSKGIRQMNEQSKKHSDGFDSKDMIWWM